jgi:DNA-binding NtrC family response regulator
LALSDATSATGLLKPSAAGPLVPSDGEETDGALSASVRRFEREQILAALRQAHGNVSRAARALRIPRNTLRHRMARLGLRHPRAPAH